MFQQMQAMAQKQVFPSVQYETVLLAQFSVLSQLRQIGENTNKTVLLIVCVPTLSVRQSFCLCVFVCTLCIAFNVFLDYLNIAFVRIAMYFLVVKMIGLKYSGNKFRKFVLYAC